MSTQARLVPNSNGCVSSSISQSNQALECYVGEMSPNKPSTDPVQRGLEDPMLQNDSARKFYKWTTCKDWIYECAAETMDGIGQVVGKPMQELHGIIFMISMCKLAFNAGYAGVSTNDISNRFLSMLCGTRRRFKVGS